MTAMDERERLARHIGEIAGYIHAPTISRIADHLLALGYRATPAPAEGQRGPLYVGAMNDGLLIVDRKPGPSPVDHVNPTRDKDTNVIATMTRNDAAALKMAEQLVAGYNAQPDRPAALEAVAVAAQAAVKWSSGANMADLESALARLTPTQESA